MQLSQEVQKKINEECAPDVEGLKKAAIDGAIYGGTGGALAGFTGIVGGALVGSGGSAAVHIKNDVQNRQKCKEEIIQEAQKPKEEPKPSVIEAQAPAPIIYSKPVNANANYTVAMNANRDRFMVRGGYRF